MLMPSRGIVEVGSPERAKMPASDSASKESATINILTSGRGRQTTTVSIGYAQRGPHGPPESDSRQTVRRRGLSDPSVQGAYPQLAS